MKCRFWKRGSWLHGAVQKDPVSIKAYFFYFHVCVHFLRDIGQHMAPPVESSTRIPPSLAKSNHDLYCGIRMGAQGHHIKHPPPISIYRKLDEYFGNHQQCGIVARWIGGMTKQASITGNSDWLHRYVAPLFVIQVKSKGTSRSCGGVSTIHRFFMKPTGLPGSRWTTTFWRSRILKSF